MADKPVTLVVNRNVAALLNRLCALDAGVHTVQLVKTQAGAAGVFGWVVTEGRLEHGRGAGDVKPPAGPAE